MINVPVNLHDVSQKAIVPIPTAVQIAHIKILRFETKVIASQPT
jgi:L-lysine 2,3-aminomutase